MAHVLEAFIGSEKELRDILAQLGVPGMPLRGGFLIVPLGQVRDRLAMSAAASKTTKPYENLAMTAAELDWALAASKRCPLVYVQTNYFGGRGEQAALLCRHGRITHGPLFHSNSDEHTPASRMPINMALRRLGVCADEELDEFDTVGLIEFRNCRT